MSGRGAPALPVLLQEQVALRATLTLVADTIVDSLGFGVAVVNLVDPQSQDMVVVAVAGSDDVRAALLDRVEPRGNWDRLLAAGVAWGTLRFIDHATGIVDPDDAYTWVPDVPVSDDPEAWHPLDELFAPLWSSTGDLLGVLSVDLPETGRRPTETTCRALEAFAVMAALALEHAQTVAAGRRDLRRLQAVFAASPVPVALVDAHRRFQDVNAAYCRFVGRDREALLGKDPLDLTHPEDLHLGLAETRLAIGARPGDGALVVPGAVEKRYVLPDGSVVWGRLHLAGLASPDEPGMVVALVEDVTERKRAEAELLRQARVDGLTGLPNRTAVLDHLRQVLETDAASDRLTAVLFCDLDRLKLVNDGYGHATGDAYLQAVARRIVDAAGRHDVVGRLGGDEFVIVCQGVSTPLEVVGLAGHVIQQVHRPLSLNGVQLDPSVSVGVANTTGGESAGDLLAQADAAMYAVKSTARGSWHVYDPTVVSSATDQLQLRADLADALDRGQLHLHYQPIVRLADGRVLGHEALLRWQHPQRGLLTPAQFLDVVLSSEYESPVTDWAVRRACLDAARRPGRVRVSVNVSSVQIGRRNLPEVVGRALADSGLPPEDLVLELTEDRLLSRGDGAQLLADLRETGVRLALDDFGSGWAGLDYLQRFPSLDMVKLDRSFTADLGRTAMAEHIVRSVVGLTRDSGLDLVVEGVETDDQRRRLRDLGVRFAQGYLFGRPLPYG